jgi:hypothetical protein
MMEARSSFETSVLRRATPRNIPEYAILQYTKLPTSSTILCKTSLGKILRFYPLSKHELPEMFCISCFHCSRARLLLDSTRLLQSPLVQSAPTPPTADVHRSWQLHVRCLPAVGELACDCSDVMQCMSCRAARSARAPTPYGHSVPSLPFQPQRIFRSTADCTEPLVCVAVARWFTFRQTHIRRERCVYLKVIALCLIKNRTWKWNV